jgi:hypothetical protein
MPRKLAAVWSCCCCHHPLQGPREDASRPFACYDGGENEWCVVVMVIVVVVVEEEVVGEVVHW